MMSVIYPLSASFITVPEPEPEPEKTYHSTSFALLTPLLPGTDYGFFSTFLMKESAVH